MCKLNSIILDNRGTFKRVNFLLNNKKLLLDYANLLQIAYVKIND